MRLKVLAPAKIIVDKEAEKIVARGLEGYFCLLPHHVDFVSGLSPGILSLEETAGGEQSLAIDEGILVKCGDEVLVATRNAFMETAAERISAADALARIAPDEEEERCRRVIAGLESDFVEQFLKES